MKKIFGIIVAVAFIGLSVSKMITLKNELSSLEFIIYLITALFFTGLLLFSLLKKNKE